MWSSFGSRRRQDIYLRDPDLISLRTARRNEHCTRIRPTYTPHKDSCFRRKRIQHIDDVVAGKCTRRRRFVYRLVGLRRISLPLVILCDNVLLAKMLAQWWFLQHVMGTVSTYRFSLIILLPPLLAPILIAPPRDRWLNNHTAPFIISSEEPIEKIFEYSPPLLRYFRYSKA